MTTTLQPDRAAASDSSASKGYDDAVDDVISHVRLAHQERRLARMADVAREIATVFGPHTRSRSTAFPGPTGDFPDQIAALEAEHRRIEAVPAEAADGATPEEREAVEATRAKAGATCPAVRLKAARPPPAGQHSRKPRTPAWCTRCPPPSAT